MTIGTEKAFLDEKEKVGDNFPALGSQAGLLPK